jgi:hypothetical protein
VAANLTYDGAEGRWKALQASGIYERRAYLTEVYRNSLARQVRSLGYEIENRRDAKGRDGALRFEASPTSFSPNTANEAVSATRPSKSSLKRMADHRRTTKLQSWCARRVPTS